MSEKKYDDRRYISCGKFYVLHLDSEIMSEGVEQLNENKVGAPFVYSDGKCSDHLDVLYHF